MGLSQETPSPVVHIPTIRGDPQGDRMKNSLETGRIATSRHHQCHSHSPPSAEEKSNRIRARYQANRSSSVHYKQAPRDSSPTSPYMQPRGIKTRQGNLPSFEKDFGPFGSVHNKRHFNSRSIPPDTGDISSMFKPPDTETPMVSRPERQTGRSRESVRPTTPKKDSRERDYNLMHEKTWDSGMKSVNKENGSPLVRSNTLPPPNHPIVNAGISTGPSSISSRRSIKRDEDLDRILAKYGKSSRSTVNTERDPDFGAGVRTDNPLKLTIDRCCNGTNVNSGPGIHAYWDGLGSQQQRSMEDRDILDKLNSAVLRNQPISTENVRGQLPPQQVGKLQGPVDKEMTTFQVSQQQQHQQLQHGDSKQDKGQMLRRSTHVFPFRETPSGHLVINPMQIAFESRKISVLVSDPNNNTATVEFTQTKCGANSLLFPPPSETGSFTNKNERILHEVKKAMSIQETNENSVMEKISNSKLAGSQSPKEINQKKYSNSKKATPQFEESILDKIASGKNADTHVIIGDKIFACHSVALEAFSNYFERMSRPPETIHRIHVPEAEVSSKAFPVLMDWILRSEEGRQDILTKENLVSVYAAARHLTMKDLESQCISFLEKRVDSNDPDLLSMWDDVKRRRSGCFELVRIIASKMAASYNEIYKAKRYLQMEADELFMLLSSDEISIDSEMDVYDSAVTWLIHDWKNRKIHTNRIMSTVRFGLLSPLQLTQINLCPELNKVKSEKDYNQILAFGTVKSMIDDGLAYSILEESYKAQPEELKKWVDKTGVKAPIPRTCLVNRKRGSALILEKISLLEDASQTKLKPNFNKVPERASSYTLLDVIPKPGTPTIQSPSDSFPGSEHPSTTACNESGKKTVSNTSSKAKTRSRSRIPKPPSKAPSRNNNYDNDKFGDVNNQSPDILVDSNQGSQMVMQELSKPKLLSNSSNTLQIAGDGLELQAITDTIYEQFNVFK